jgi:hypothetical protein
MKRLRVFFTAIAWLVTCGAAQSAETGPKAYLTEEYFRKQRECEARRPPVHDFDISADYSQRIIDSGRPAVWKAQRMYLGETCMVANAGPYYYVGAEDGPPAGYAIDVEARGLNSAQSTTANYRVLFERQFRPEELPNGFEHTEIAKIVSFNASDRVVSFELPGRVFQYRVPAL